jgi:predicted GNAT family acetyltransferase
MDIFHNKEDRRFYTIIDDKEYSLEYNIIENNLWEFNCSYISSIVTNLKKRDIREALIEYAIDYMERNDIKIMDSGTCFQGRDYLEKKKDLEFLVRFVIRSSK